MGVDLGGSFLLYGPFIAGFGFVYFVCGPPKICLALAIFNFSSGVMNFFFYYGLAGGITTTGGFIVGFYYPFTGDYIFTLNGKFNCYSWFETNGKDC